MNVGTNGADISVGNLAQAMKGFKAWGINAKMLVSGQEEAKAYKVALRTLASTGDKKDTELYERVLKGETNITKDGKGEYTARTVTRGGVNTIELGAMNEVLTSELSMGVLLSHEARRNALDDGEAEQQLETAEAFLGHIETAKMLEQTYGTGSLGGLMSGEVAAALAGDMNKLQEYFGAYDSRADYWKLMANGDLVDDGDGWLKDQNGNLIKDNKGNKIGADGKETGLLNILFGGTNNVAYSQFSDAQIATVQRLMESSGMVHSGQVDPRARSWNGSIGSTIIANSILAGFGDSVATSVFMNGMDRATDLVLFSDNFNLIDRTISSIPELAESRFASYLNAKSSFYGGEHTLFQNTRGLSLSQIFQENTAYNGNQHRGGDVAGPNGTKIQAGYGGKVVSNIGDSETSTSGNTLIVEYGFNFENSFYSTGIRAQFMHLAGKSSYEVGQTVIADTIIGKMGNTGWVDPEPTRDNPLLGTHLHYQLMGNLPGYGPKNSAWSMLDSRRNTFLAQIGAPSTRDYVFNQGTSVINNYTGSVGNPAVDYYNYFYSPNDWLKRMGLK